MSTRRYKLLNDLPDAVAGTVFTFTDEGDSKGYLSLGKLGGDIWYRKDIVEQNSQWFEEIKPERIEVSVGGAAWVENGAEKLIIATSPAYPIPEDKFTEIKKAIENVLNGNPIGVKFIKSDGHWLSVYFSPKFPEDELAAMKAVIQNVADGQIAKMYTQEDIISLLTACVSSTWGSLSIDETQKLYDQFLMDKKFHTDKSNNTITKMVNEILLDKKYTQEQYNKGIEDAFFAGRETQRHHIGNRWKYPTIISYMDYLKSLTP